MPRLLMYLKDTTFFEQITNIEKLEDELINAVIITIKHVTEIELAPSNVEVGWLPFLRSRNAADITADVQFTVGEHGLYLNENETERLTLALKNALAQTLYATEWLPENVTVAAWPIPVKDTVFGIYTRGKLLWVESISFDSAEKIITVNIDHPAFLQTPNDLLTVTLFKGDQQIGEGDDYIYNGNDFWHNDNHADVAIYCADILPAGEYVLKITCGDIEFRHTFEIKDSDWVADNDD